jgi:hypothetical protein
MKDGRAEAPYSMGMFFWFCVDGLKTNHAKLVLVIERRNGAEAPF